MISLSFYYYVFSIALVFIIFIFRKLELPADYQSYVGIFNDSLNYVYQNEYGFWGLIRIFQILGLDADQFLFSVSFIILFMYVYGAWSCNIKGQYILYLLAAPSFLLFAVNGIRQGLAMGLILMALGSTSRLRLVFFILAPLFHISSAPIIILAWIYYKFMRPGNVIYISLLLFVGSGYFLLDVLMLNRTFNSYYDIYYGSKTTYYARLMLYLLIFVYLKDKLFKDFKFRMNDALIMASLSFGLLSLGNELLSSRFLYYAEILIIFRLFGLFELKKFSVLSGYILFLLSLIFFFVLFSFPSIYIQYF